MVRAKLDTGTSLSCMCSTASRGLARPRLWILGPRTRTRTTFLDQSAIHLPYPHPSAVTIAQMSFASIEM